MDLKASQASGDSSGSHYHSADDADVIIQHTGGSHAIQVLECAAQSTDPFTTLLTDYLKLPEGHTRQSVATQPKQVKDRDVPPSHIHTQYHATPDADECRKLRERIAVLETRQHELCSLLHVESEEKDDQDIKYMERNRLEAECKKLKVQKKSMEKLATEAKQTALRLSAENCTLKEDIMQEKHHNELIIRNISRQKEQRRGNMELHFMVREHVMADEIRKRAAMLAAQMGTSGHSAPLLQLDEVSKTILSSSLKLNFVTVWSISRNSCKPSVAEQTHKGKKSEHCSFLGSNDCLSSQDIVYTENNNDITGNVPVHEANRMGIAAAALSCIYLEKGAQSIALSVPFQKNVYSNQILNTHLTAVVTDVNKLLKSSFERDKWSKLTFVKENEMRVSWALFEVLPAFFSSHKPRILLLFTLSLPDDASRLNEISLQSEENIEEGNVDHYVSKWYTPLNGIIRTVHCYSSSPSTMLLVGIHLKEVGNFDVVKKGMYSSVQSHLEGIGLGDVLCSKVLDINCRTKGSAAQLLGKFNVVLAMSSKHTKDHYIINVPLRVLFLRYLIVEYARENDLWYITEGKLFNIAKDLNIFSVEDVMCFLTCFEQCGNILYCRVEQFSSLHENIVIINIATFVNLVNRLSYAQQLLSPFCSSDEPLSAYLHKLNLGMVCSKLAKMLWVTDHEVFLQILESIGTATLIDIISDDDKVYFIPSLRSSYLYKDIVCTSCALYITFCPITFPCSYVGTFYSLLKNIYHPDIKLLDGTYCNQIELQWNGHGNTIAVAFRITDSYAEVEVSEIAEQDTETMFEIKAVLKTAIIDLFQTIACRFPEFWYEMCVVCPRISSYGTPASPHFIKFHALQTVCNNGTVYCTQCKSNVDVGEQRADWMKAIYKRSKTLALQSREIISDVLLMELSEMLNVEGPWDVVQLCYALGCQVEIEAVCASPPRVVLLSTLFNWREVYPVPTREELSFVLMENGYSNEALLLNANLLGEIPSSMPQWLSEKELVVTSDLVMDYRRLGLELGLADLDLKSFESFALHEQCLQMLLVWMHNVMDINAKPSGHTLQGPRLSNTSVPFLHADLNVASKNQQLTFQRSTSLPLLSRQHCASSLKRASVNLCDYYPESLIDAIQNESVNQPDHPTIPLVTKAAQKPDALLQVHGSSCRQQLVNALRRCGYWRAAEALQTRCSYILLK